VVACRHCGADFTIHETDQDTVCPSCLARVSDQAQFCHHCGTPLVAELVAGEDTEYTCPVCGPDRTLTSRRLTDEGLSVLECETCAGLWLGLETFQLLLKQEARQPKPATARRSTIGQPQSGPRYRRCVICGQLMVRKNLDEGKSGVIVDLCGSHGIWFDAEELAQLFAWMRSGGLEGVRGDVAKLRRSGDPVGKRQAQQKAEAGRRARAADNAASSFSGTPVLGDFDPPQDDPMVDIGAAVLRVIGALFVHWR
jgi:Zn-finger nucleic acid-binding protein